MLVKNVLFLGLAAVASAQKFAGFTAGGISCTNGVSVTKAEVDSAMVGPKGNKREERADNLASGRCATLKFPLYSVKVSGKFNLMYSFEKASNTYHFCSASVSGSGYGPQCQPK